MFHSRFLAKRVVASASLRSSLVGRAVVSQAQRGFLTAAKAQVARSALAVPLAAPSFTARRHFASHTEVVPSLGDSISEGTVGDIEKQVGDYVFVDDVFLTVETDKVGTELRAGQAGKITEIKVEEGDTVEVGDELIVVDTAAEAPAQAESAAAEPAAAESSSTAAAASAPKAAAPAASKAKSKPAPASPQVAPSAPGSREQREVPMSRMRQTIARRLKEAQNTAALLTTFQEVDMSGIMELRSKYKDEFLASRGVKLGFMSCFTAASVSALQKFPDVNAYFDLENKKIVYNDYCDVSIAVATPTGLLTPVLRNCEDLDFAGIEGAISALGAKARDNKLALEDLAGGTFTISNGGVYGSLMGTPILNPPQSAVLGMHGIFPRPVAVNGEVVIRPMMYVALTYDHRIIDGSTGVQFLKHIKQSVEDPARLLLKV